MSSVVARTLLSRASRLRKASFRPISTSREVAAKRKGTTASKAVVAEPIMKCTTQEKLPPLHYKCPNCAFSHADKISIKAHLKKVHNAPPFSCPHCAQGFTNFLKLQAHIKSSHKKAAIPIEPYELVSPTQLIDEAAKEQETSSPVKPKVNIPKVVLDEAPRQIVWPSLKYYMTLHPLKSQSFADFHFEEETLPVQPEMPLEIVWPSVKYFMGLYPLKSQNFADVNYEETSNYTSCHVPECPEILWAWPSQKYFQSLYPFKSPNLTSHAYCVSEPQVNETLVVEAIPVEERSAFVQSSLKAGPSHAGTDVDNLMRDSQEALKRASNEALRIAAEVSNEALKKATVASNEALKKATEVFKSLMSSLK